MLEDICAMEELIKGNTYNDVNINAAVNILRIKIDAIKWLLSKLAPKEYGDKIEVNATTTTTQVFKIGDTEIAM